MPSTGLLVGTMSLGALLVLAIPYVDDRVLAVRRRLGSRRALNPLVAAAILFGPMSVVLAAVTPIAVRIAALDVATLGRTAGRLFAVSTVGSIVGTFATAFVLIPELGTNQLLALGAAVLLAGPALVAVARSLPIVGVAALAAAAAAAALSSSLAPEQGGTLTAAAAENYSPVYRLQEGSVADSTDYAVEGFRVRYRKDSAYHSIAVVEDEQDRYLRFDSSFQSAMDLRRPVCDAVRLRALSLACVRVSPGGGERALRRARWGLRAEACVARLPAICSCRRSSSTPKSSTSRGSGSRFRRIPGSPSRSRTGVATSSGTTGAGT